MEFGKFSGIIFNFSDLAVVQLPIVPIDIRPYCRRADIPARRIADGRPAQCVDRRFARRTEVFRRFVQIRCGKGSTAAGQYAAEAARRQSACCPVQHTPAYAAFFPGVVAALVFGKVGAYLAECCADGGFFGFAVRILQFGLQQGFGCLIPFVISGVTEFVGNGRCGLGGIFAELLRYFPLQVDLFGNRVFVEAVFQTTCVLGYSFGVDAGVDMCFGFFGSPAGSGKLSRFVGDVYVAGVDAAAGGAVFAVSVAAVAGGRADPVGRPALFVGNRAVPAAVQVETAAYAEAFAFVAAVVLNVAMGEGRRLKEVFALIFCALARRDDTALEVCVISDFDLIAVFSGINTALFGYGGMVCFDFALAVTAAGTESVAEGNLDVAVLLFALIGFAILYALNT